MLIAAAAIACAGHVRINSVPDPPPSLRGYLTYTWISQEPPTAGRDGSRAAALDAKIRSEVARWLEIKGYSYRTLGAPDFLIGYRVQVKEKDTETFADLYAYRQAGGTDSVSEAFGRGYEEGTLVLEFFDARTRQRLWQTSAAAVLGHEPTTDRITQAVRRMLEKLPRADAGS